MWPVMGNQSKLSTMDIVRWDLAHKNVRYTFVGYVLTESKFETDAGKRE